MEEKEILSINLLKEFKENNPQIKNIMLFISDSLRWDYLPKSISSRGITFKTIASGIWSPPSFSSILTGLYPQNHGVHSFFNKLRKGTSSLFNLSGYNSSLWTENTWIQWKKELPPIHRMLNQQNRIPLSEINSPFIYVEDEKGGHCPYGWSVDDKYDEWDCFNFFKDYGRKEVIELKRRYELGIKRSVKEFDRCIRTLNERDLLNETLVIFLSDHGELLGEYGGIVGHGYLTTPEIVYVPTVFIHPDLPKGIKIEDDGIIRHIDLYPTILHIIGKTMLNKVDGINLFEVDNLPRVGMTYHLIEKRIKKRLIFKLIEKSVWDKNGGYMIRNNTKQIILLLRALNITILNKGSIIAIYQRARAKKLGLSKWTRDFVKSLKYFCSKSIIYNDPTFNINLARFLLRAWEVNAKH